MDTTTVQIAAGVIVFGIAIVAIVVAWKRRKNPRPRTLGSASVLFGFALLVWLATVSHDFLGFVLPVSAEGVGFDFFTLLIWVWLCRTAITLFRTVKYQRGRKALERMIRQNTSGGNPYEQESSILRNLAQFDEFAGGKMSAQIVRSFIERKAAESPVS